MLVRRTKSEPVTYDSDENAVENLSYNEDIFYGWDEVEDVPAPVQVKRPERHSRRPGDRLHKAVWSNDPAKVQKLVLYEGLYEAECLWSVVYFILSKNLLHVKPSVTGGQPTVE